MSVQNQINRINSEVIAQATLIAQALSALEGKQEGGGDSSSMQVCDVTVINNTSHGVSLNMVCIVENVGSGLNNNVQGQNTVTYSCAMESIFKFQVHVASVPNFSISYSDGIEVIYLSPSGESGTFKLPSAATTATITITANGGGNEEPV